MVWCSFWAWVNAPLRPECPERRQPIDMQELCQRFNLCFRLTECRWFDIFVRQSAFFDTPGRRRRAMSGECRGVKQLTESSFG